MTNTSEYAKKVLKSRKPIAINDALMRGLGYADTRDFFSALYFWGYNTDFNAIPAACDTHVQSYIRTFIKENFIN